LLTMTLPFPALAGPSGAAFLEINPSAHAYALGESYALTALGAQALGSGSNIANLGLMTRRYDVTSSYASLIGGAAYEHLGAAWAPSSQILGLDAVGFSVTRLQSGGFQGA